jgi:hypothetical protein
LTYIFGQVNTIPTNISGLVYICHG